MSRIARSLMTLLLASSVVGCATVTSKPVGDASKIDRSATVASSETLKPAACDPKDDCPIALGGAEHPQQIVAGADQAGKSGAPVRARPRGEQVAPEPPAKPSSSGLAYFLPRQLVRVTATRTGGALDDKIRAVIKTQGDLEVAEAKVTASEAAIRATEEQIIAGSGGDAGKLILAARLLAQKAELDTNKKAIDGKTKARDTAKAELTQFTTVAPPAPAPAPLPLAKGKAAKPLVKAEEAVAPEGGAPKATVAMVKGAPEPKEGAAEATGEKPGPNSGPGAYKVALKLELLPPSADPSQAYRLSPRHTIFRDDEHKLTISSSGLLSSANIVATDRAGDMLVEIAAFAGAIQGGAGSVIGRDGRPVVPPVNCKTSLSEFTGVVDFVDARAVDALNGYLQCMGVKLIPDGTFWRGDTGPKADPASAYDAIEGIVYRSPVEVQVAIVKCMDTEGACSDTSDNWHTAEVVALALPQAGPISYLRQDSGLLTKTKYDLTFSNGIPVDYSGSRPSEILEVGRLPIRLVNSAFDGLSKVISLRTGVNNDKAALATSQLAYANSLIALQAGSITGQKTIADQQLAALQSQIALQAGAITGQKTITDQQLAALQSQYALQAADFQGKTNLSVAEVALLQQQYATLVAQRTGATSLTNADLIQLQAQYNLLVGQNTGAAQVSASNLALTLAQLRDQARRDTLNRCVAEKLAANQGIEPCLADL